MKDIAVILAAGRGKRLSPLTDVCPKPLLKYRGKSFYEYALKGVERADIREIFVVTGHLGHQIRDNQFEGKHSVDLFFVEQQKQIGSADALSCALREIPHSPEEIRSIAVVASDYVLPVEAILGLKEKMLNLDADGAVLVVSADKNSAAKGSIVTWGDAEQVVSIEEKPNRSLEEACYDTAKLVYVFNWRVVRELRRSVPIESREESIPDRVNSLIRQGAKFVGLRYARFPEADSAVF